MYRSMLSWKITASITIFAVDFAMIAITMTTVTVPVVTGLLWMRCLIN